MSFADPPRFLEELFRAAVSAADPAGCVVEHLPEKPRGRTIVVGAGKASAAMAAAVEQAWDAPLEGLVITPYDHGVFCERVEIVEAAHPVPDHAGQAAAGRIVKLVESAGPEDLVLCLISGGGSALLAAPGGSLTLEDKQAVNRSLLRCGATIREMNCLRKHLSAVKGGRLAAIAAPARIVSLVISDVPGDDPSVVASGPTLPDPTTRQDTLDILDRYQVDVPASLLDWLSNPESETPKPGDPIFERCETTTIATPQMSLDAACGLARCHGVASHVLGDGIEGEARDVALVHAGIARQVALRGQPFEPPCVLLSGGETSVTVRGQGRGGRNVEFLLALALTLEGRPDIWALACDTDGIDGAATVAGATLAPDTLARARGLGLDPRSLLDENDAHRFFETLGDQVITGPTRTNVNDFRALYIGS